MDKSRHWEPVARAYVDSINGMIRERLGAFRDALDAWLNGILAGPIPDDWRDRLDRFVQERAALGVGIRPHSIEALAQLIESRAASAAGATSDGPVRRVQSRSAADGAFVQRVVPNASGPGNPPADGQIILGPEFVYPNPRNHDQRLRAPLSVTWGGKTIYLGDLDFQGGYVERSTSLDPKTGLPNRVAPSALDAAAGRADAATTNWNAWFATNRLRHADDSSDAQLRAEALGLQQFHDDAARTAAGITLLAEVDLMAYQLALGLAQPQSVAKIASVGTAVERAGTVQASTQREVQLGKVILSNQQRGPAASKSPSRFSRTKAPSRSFTILKNASNNGFDIVAKTHTGKYVFYEVKTSSGAVAPALKGLQREGATEFARSRLAQMAVPGGRFTGISAEQVAAARRLKNAVEAAGKVEEHVINITNLGQPTQAFEVVHWGP